MIISKGWSSELCSCHKCKRQIDHMQIQWPGALSLFVRTWFLHQSGPVRRMPPAVRLAIGLLLTLSEMHHIAVLPPRTGCSIAGQGYL